MTRLDVMSMRPQWKSFCVVPILILFFAFQSNDPIIPAITAAWTTAMLVTLVFAVQEQNHLERLYATLPVDGDAVVKGRYCSTILAFLLALVFAEVVVALRGVFQSGGISLAELPLAAALSWAMFAVVSALQLPVFFAFGYTKARLVALIPFLCLMFVFFIPAVQDFLGRAANGVGWEGPLPIMILLVLGISVFVVSLAVSTLLYRTRRR